MIDGSVRFETVAERNLCVGFAWKVKLEMDRCYAENDPEFRMVLTGGEDLLAAQVLLCVQRTVVDTQAEQQYRET